MAEYRRATSDDLQFLWSENIRKNEGDERWVHWRNEYIEYNENGSAITFAVIIDGKAVGEGTLLFSPDCSAVNGRLMLADGNSVVNLNALRIIPEYEGLGHISKLVKLMEAYAKQRGFERITIGVEAKETRNLAIYLHWGYDRLVMSEIEDGELVLYYEKKLTD